MNSLKPKYRKAKNYVIFKKRPKFQQVYKTSKDNFHRVNTYNRNYLPFRQREKFAWHNKKKYVKTLKLKKLILRNFASGCDSQETKRNFLKGKIVFMTYNKNKKMIFRSKPRMKMVECPMPSIEECRRIFRPSKHFVNGKPVEQYPVEYVLKAKYRGKYYVDTKNPGFKLKRKAVAYHNKKKFQLISDILPTYEKAVRLSLLKTKKQLNKFRKTLSKTTLKRIDGYNSANQLSY